MNTNYSAKYDIPISGQGCYVFLLLFLETNTEEVVETKSESGMEAVDKLAHLDLSCLSSQELYLIQSKAMAFMTKLTLPLT